MSERHGGGNRLGGKEMTRKLVEFLETNMGMVEDNLGRLVTILHILYYIPAGSNNGNK